MTETQKQVFKYRGDDLVKGGDLVDRQVREWYLNNPNCKVIKLQDERILEVKKNLECECVINVIMEYEPREKE